MTSTENLKALSQDSDYDPNSMPVEQARKYIANFLEPVTSSEKVSIRDSLGRILSENVISLLSTSPSMITLLWTDMR